MSLIFTLGSKVPGVHNQKTNPLKMDQDSITKMCFSRNLEEL